LKIGRRLEDWAKINGKKLLAITRDKGWIAFCEKSEWIDTEPDVSNALQRFQAHTESARRLVASLLSSIAAGERQDVKNELEERLASEIVEIEPVIEACSDFYWSANLSISEWGISAFLHLTTPSKSYKHGRMVSLLGLRSKLPHEWMSSLITLLTQIMPARLARTMRALRRSFAPALSLPYKEMPPMTAR
jgi:hypothetical protein